MESQKRKIEQWNGTVDKEGLGGRDNGSSKTITNQKMGGEFSFCMQGRNGHGRLDKSLRLEGRKWLIAVN